MRFTKCNFGGIAQGCYRSSGFSAGVAGISELSVGISAPAFNASGGKYGTSVLISSTNISSSADSRNRNRCAPIYKRIVSELSVSSVAPAFHHSVGKTGTCVTGPRRNFCGSGNSGNADGCIGITCRSVPQLSIPSESPTFDATGTEQGAAM